MKKPSCLLYTKINGSGGGARPVVWSSGFPHREGKRALFVSHTVSRAKESFFILLELEVPDET